MLRFTPALAQVAARTAAQRPLRNATIVHATKSASVAVNPVSALVRSFARNYAGPQKGEPDTGGYDPFYETYDDEVKNDDDDYEDATEGDPRVVQEPQLAAKSEHPLFRRTWERHHDRVQQRMAQIEAENAEEELEQLLPTAAPWTRLVGPEGLVAPDPVEEKHYLEFDPDLKETWEDQYYRAALSGDTGLDAPGGDWGSSRMSYGISPPVKIYYRAMIDALEESDHAAVTQLYEGVLEDREVGHHEIPAGLLRIAMLSYVAQGQPNTARQCFQRICETNDAKVEDYVILSSGFLDVVALGDAVAVYHTLLKSPLITPENKVPAEAHKVAYVAAKVLGDQYTVTLARTHLKRDKVPLPSKDEIRIFKMRFAIEQRNIDDAINAYTDFKEHIDFAKAGTAERLAEASWIMMTMYADAGKFDKVLEVYRFGCVENADWALQNANVAAQAIRAYLETDEPAEAQALLEKIESVEVEDDFLSVQLYAPFVTYFAKQGNMEAAFEIMEKVEELNLLEKPEDATTMVNAFIAAKPNDPAHVEQWFGNLLEAEAGVDDKSLGTLIKSHLDNGKIEKLESWWPSICRNLVHMPLHTSEAHTQALRFCYMKKDLDGVMAVARALHVNGSRADGVFARELAKTLAHCLPERYPGVTDTLLTRFENFPASPKFLTTQQQHALLHVVEKTRANVKELFIN